MKMPFPGMDPYLEHPLLWTAVHSRLISWIDVHLAPLLQPRYTTSIEERIVIEGAPQQRIPDLWVQKADSNGGRIAVAPIATRAPVVVEVEGLEIRQKYLEILDSYQEMRVVTVIEIVSPTNKEAGPGREAYVAKQAATLISDCHLVEIDLLRRGRHVLSVPEHRARAEANYDYLACVNRFPNRRRFELFPWGLRDRVPTVWIPLVAPDGDVPIDLQAALEDIFTLGNYARRVRHEEACVPALSAADQRWAWECWSAFKKARKDLFPDTPPSAETNGPAT